MIRNLKTFGLALVAVLALSAVATSAASAEKATFTAAVEPEELALIHAEQIGTNTFTIGGKALTCATANATGNPVDAADKPLKGSQSTYVTLTPEYKECHVVIFGITKPITVTHNECNYKFNATKNTANTPWSADLTIECPTGKKIEIHVYNNAAHTELLCTYDVTHQTVNDKIQLTNEPEVKHETGEVTPDDVVAHINLTIPVHNTKTGALCGFNEIENATYAGTQTIRATNEPGKFVKTTVS